MGQYFATQTGHETDEGDPWSRDMTSEGPKSTEGHGIVRTGTSPAERPQGTRGGLSPNESHSGARCGASSFESPRGAQRRTSPSESHSGATNVGLDVHEVQANGSGSLRGEGSYVEGMTSEDGRTPKLAAFPVAERRPEGRSLSEQRHEGYEGESARATPVPVIRPVSTEGMSFGDSAYRTSSTDRPAAPEDTWTSDDAEGILSETKYETAPDTVDPKVKKKLQQRK